MTDPNQKRIKVASLDDPQKVFSLLLRPKDTAFVLKRIICASLAVPMWEIHVFVPRVSYALKDNERLYDLMNSNETVSFKLIPHAKEEKSMSGSPKRAHIGIIEVAGETQMEDVPPTQPRWEEEADDASLPMPNGDLASLQMPTDDQSTKQMPNGDLASLPRPNGDQSTLQMPTDQSSLQMPTDDQSSLQMPTDDLASSQMPNGDLASSQRPNGDLALHESLPTLPVPEPLPTLPEPESLPTLPEPKRLSAEEIAACEAETQLQCSPIPVLDSQDGMDVDSEQPSVPNTSQPTGPKTSQPTVPNTSQPSVPNTSQPTGPKTSQPTVPNTSQPSVPNMSLPWGPNTEQPSVPNMSQAWDTDTTANDGDDGDEYSQSEVNSEDLEALMEEQRASNLADVEMPDADDILYSKLRGMLKDEGDKASTALLDPYATPAKITDPYGTPGSAKRDIPSDDPYDGPSPLAVIPTALSFDDPDEEEFEDMTRVFGRLGENAHAATQEAAPAATQAPTAAADTVEQLKKAGVKVLTKEQEDRNREMQAMRRALKNADQTVHEFKTRIGGKSRLATECMFQLFMIDRTFGNVKAAETARKKREQSMSRKGRWLMEFQLLKDTVALN